MMTFSERLIQNRRLAAIRDVTPGALVALLIAAAATFVSSERGGPVMLYALLIGMAFHFLSQEGRCKAGIEFASKRVLRIGVALLGARITADQVFALGWQPVALVIGAVGLTLMVGLAASRAFGLSARFGALTGGATAICGASAALAIAAVLPKGPNAERDTIFTVIGVTTLSTVAMVLYPVIASLLGLTSEQAGLFLGGTIHDVAQVVGAGYSVSQEVGDVATLTKLLRVALLLPVVMIIAFAFGGSAEARQGPALPLFLVAFAALVVINSLGVIPPALEDVIQTTSRWCLVTAIAALGMKTSLKAIAAVGWVPVGLIVLETLFMAGLVTAALLILF